MYKKNIYGKIIVCILFPMNMIYSLDLSQVGKICAGVGTFLVAAGAAAVGVDWLISPTDEQLINRVKQDCDIIISNNKEYVVLFKRMLYWDKYSQSVHREVLNNLCEMFLYEIARLNDSAYGQTFPTIVIQHCAALEKHVKSLLQRIDNMQRQQFLTEQERYHLSVMRTLVEQIIGLQEELGLLRDYIIKHTSYFALAECGWAVHKKYNAELELCDLYKYDQYRLLQKLDALIYKKYNYNAFAYISYVEDIESTIGKLLYVRNRSAFNYAGMITWVDQCIDQLRFIRAAIENRYQLQMLERERMYIAQKLGGF